LRESSRLNISLAVSVIFLLSSAVYAPIINADDTVDDLVFIHHSCGNNWLNDGLHVALLTKDYIDERNDITYGTDVIPNSGRPDSLASIPGDKTNMNHWILWFNDYLNNVKNHGCADGFNKIIMFKSCYPGSDIAGDGTEPGDPFSSTKTLANYKAVYRHYNGPGETYTDSVYTYKPLQDIFAENPDILFIPVTAPPLHYTATNDANAHRARMFNNWLKNDWLNDYNSEHPGLNNVAVYDWFDFLAYPDDHSDHPNRLKGEYGGGSGNSHPNTLANQESTVDFATGTNNFIDTKWNAFIIESVENKPPHPPMNPLPVDGATDIPVSTSQLSVDIKDPEGDSLNWSIECSNGDSSSGYGEFNGTKSCPLTSGLNYNTTYTWYVNIIDSGSGSTRSETYTFTNEDNKTNDDDLQPHQNDEEKNDKTQSPDFELVAILIALAILLFFKNKKEG
jgi:hypothetical protein